MDQKPNGASQQRRQEAKQQRSLKERKNCNAKPQQQWKKVKKTKHKKPKNEHACNMKQPTIVTNYYHAKGHWVLQNGQTYRFILELLKSSWKKEVEWYLNNNKFTMLPFCTWKAMAWLRLSRAGSSPSSSLSSSSSLHCAERKKHRSLL